MYPLYRSRRHIKKTPLFSGPFCHKSRYFLGPVQISEAHLHQTSVRPRYDRTSRPVFLALSTDRPSIGRPEIGSPEVLPSQASRGTSLSSTKKHFTYEPLLVQRVAARVLEFWPWLSRCIKGNLQDASCPRLDFNRLHRRIRTRKVTVFF